MFQLHLSEQPGVAARGMAETPAAKKYLTKESMTWEREGGRKV